MIQTQNLPPVPLLDLSREYADIAAELREQWDRTLARLQLLNGPESRAFELEMAAYLGVQHVFGVASGTDALQLGMEAGGIHRGDRVALPANAFVAALEAVHHLGAEPVLIDCRAESFEPDYEQLDNIRDFRAVVVVHLYGAAFDLSIPQRICAPRQALLLEDASHAHGAERAGCKVGSIGNVGCFSAGVVKNLGAYGDAGFVAVSDSTLANRLRLLRIHGQEQKNHHVTYGYNSRLDELQAAVLRVKLRHLDRRNERRRQIAKYYGERFAPLPVRCPSSDATETPVYHQYVIRVDRREDLGRHLKSCGIESGIHYPVPLHRQPAWLRHYGESPPLPNAERAAREILSLPVFPELSDAEIERVAEAVRSFFC